MFRKYTQAPEVPPLEGFTFTDPSIPSRACCPARPVVGDYAAECARDA
jgi:hypothetical protein